MKALAMPQLQQKFAAQGTDVVPLGGQAFDRYFNAEMTRWAKVVKDAGIKVE
jgi:tripartite-type tricarboxylate transporter receptor subunit TctC